MSVRNDQIDLKLFAANSSPTTSFSSSRVLRPGAKWTTSSAGSSGNTATTMLFEGATPSAPTTSRLPEFLAVVLCGPGQDLYPLTGTDGAAPKATLPVANRPVIDYVLNWIEESGLSSKASSRFPLTLALTQGTGFRSPRPGSRVGKASDQLGITGQENGSQVRSPDRPRVFGRR